jgi:hypothetical protein
MMPLTMPGCLAFSATASSCASRSAAGRAALIAIGGAFVASAGVLAQAPVPPSAPTAQAAKQAVAPQPAMKDEMRKAGPRAKPRDQKASKRQEIVEKRMVVVDAAAANLGPMIDQFSRQGRPWVRAEVLFVRKTCLPSTEQLRTISHEADDALKAVVTQLAEAQQRPRRVVVNGRIQQPQNLDGGKLLHDGLEAVMKKHLTPDQWTRYLAEDKMRARCRRQSGVGYLVDTIDRELFLSEEQRDKLAESLSAHWEDAWGLHLEYALFGNHFYPITVDPYVTPILNDNQKKVWQSVQRVGGFWGLSGVWDGFMNDDDGLEEELGEVKKKAAPPAFKAQMFLAPVVTTEIRSVEVKTGVAKETAAKK